MPKYLLIFVHRHVDFRLAELDAVLTLGGLRPEDCYQKEEIAKLIEAHRVSVTTRKQLKEAEEVAVSPSMIISLPSLEDAKFISTRAILVKGIYELWGYGEDYASMLHMVEKYPKGDMLNYSWRMDVESFGSSLSLKEQEERRQMVQKVITFPGDVVMKNPDNRFMVYEEIGVTTAEMECGKPKCVYFLRLVSGGYKNRGRIGARNLIDKQTLKKRAYIGPTSMDAELSLIMANLGLIQPGHIVLDPFVGTGSILVPCTSLGAFCFGTDIDRNILKGKHNKDVFSNFTQYGLPLPELLRADNSKCPLQMNDFFDTIICDPPYGIRAGAKKSGVPLDKQHTIPKQFFENHFPRTQPYESEELMSDLLTMAATSLKLSGRLVYILPSTYDFTIQDLPVHPHLQLVFNCEQPLTSTYARRVIVMERVQTKLSVCSEFSFDKLRNTVKSVNNKRTRIN